MNGQTHNDTPSRNTKQLAHIHVHNQVLSLMLRAGLPWASPYSSPLGLVPWASLFWGKGQIVRQGGPLGWQRGHWTVRIRGSAQKLTWPWEMSDRDVEAGEGSILLTIA